jgi:hypothetical protein
LTHEEAQTIVADAKKRVEQVEEEWRYQPTEKIKGVFRRLRSFWT